MNQATSPLQTALAKLQASPIVATKSTEGQVGSRKYNYATLEDYWEACRKRLNDADLVVTQVVDANDVVTTLSAKGDDNFIQSRVPIVGAEDMQRLGSAITYARRYGLVVTVGILTGEDDDGHVASAQKPSQAAPNIASPTVKLSSEQQGLIFAMFEEREVPEETKQAIRDKVRDNSLSRAGASEVIEKLKEFPKK